MGFDRTLPPELAELNAIEFDYDGGDGIDFEPYPEFMPSEENQSWIRAWTGNQELTGSEYRVFGQDGTGGYAALWLAREGKPLLDQPVVFFGSEGELGIVAPSFWDYLWLVAGGYGPLEAVSYPPDSDAPRRDMPEVRALAERVAKGRQKSPRAILAAAAAEFPDFEKNFRTLVKY
jgi:hypothetical protein